ncbi:hypothetical protein DNTS_023680 [Danionella cerebrum]|uniref:Cystatin domain-containing protein n=1 Tax=Danionella cerebrum TaxID=2873325 RepID=A0A553MMK3_9TELE|nr:hypothetical protein DNTS_023680 [Danionella translucida]
MDKYFLLLLSFLSVLHLSTADQPLEETVVVARKVEMLGGWTNANPEREDIQEAAKEAVEHFNSKSRAKKYFKLIDITSARTQITNKINYKIEAIIGKTKCRKSKDANMDACLLAKKQLACKFDVTLDPVKDDHKVQQISCKKFS